MKPTSKIAIVGVGQVGGAAANAIVLSSIASEVLLVDSDIDRRDAQVQDLSDVAYSQKGVTRVQAATYEEAAQSDIIVITAGSRHFFGKICDFHAIWHFLCNISDPVARSMQHRLHGQERFNGFEYNQVNGPIQSQRNSAHRGKPCRPAYINCPRTIRASEASSTGCRNLPRLHSAPRSGGSAIGGEYNLVFLRTIFHAN